MGLATSKSDFDVVIPLKPSFRFAHEPLAEPGRADSDEALFVGRDGAVEELCHRILRSRGGSFLLTGYRGVGKTSFVNRVVRELGTASRSAPGRLPVEVVDVRLNLARAVEPIQLLHHVIRGLHRRLEDKGLLRRIDGATRRALRLAYDRTSFRISMSSGIGLESGPGLPWISRLAPKLSLNRARELEFLAYDESAAEQDLIRVAQDLSGQVVEAEPSVLKRALRRLFLLPPRWRRLQVVFVFDELDKISPDADHRSPVGDMIGHLKNLLTTSGIAFLFIAGRELEEVWHRDVLRGDSVYESVFSFNGYVPLLWEGAEAICERMVDRPPDAADDDDPITATFAPQTVAASAHTTPVGWSGRNGLDAEGVYRDFKRFVAYHGRGIPRRVLRTLHAQVAWDEEGAFLGFRRDDYRSVRFYSELELILKDAVSELVDPEDRTLSPVQRDHRRLAVYYLVDWMIGRGRSSFTIAEAVWACRQLSDKIALDEELAGDFIARLVQRLVENRMLEEAKPGWQSMILVDGERREPTYRLRPERSNQLARARDIEPPPPLPRTLPEPPDRLDRFEIRDVIAAGGFSRIYRAWDPESRQEVALKVFKSVPGLEFIDFFDHEAAVLADLRQPGHAGIVAFLGAHRDGDWPYLVLELLDGASMWHRVGRPTDWRVAMTIARKAASAYDYVHRNGFVHLDIKPGNIVVTRAGRVVVVDLGIARSPERPFPTAGLVGTPAYMAPEMVRGERIDERSDVFALGITLYQMLAGRLPFATGRGTTTGVIARALEHEPAPTFETDVPEPVAALVFKCLESDPARRFQNMREVLDTMPGVTLAPRDLAAWVAESRQRERSEHAADATVSFVAPPDTLPPAASRGRPVPATGPATAAAPRRARATTDRTILPAVADTDVRADTRVRVDTAHAAPGSSTPSVAGAAVGGSGRFRLYVLAGPDRGRSWWLTRDEAVIGRAGWSADIELDDVGLSRSHAVIRRQSTDAGGDRYLLQDLGSANGTFVGERMIRHPVWLEDGHRIRLGASVLAVELRPQHEPMTAAPSTSVRD